MSYSSASGLARTTGGRIRQSRPFSLLYDEGHVAMTRSHVTEKDDSSNDNIPFTCVRRWDRIASEWGLYCTRLSFSKSVVPLRMEQRE
eukprot:9109898-Pyramimonas_sp.AAC.2